MHCRVGLRRGKLLTAAICLLLIGFVHSAFAGPGDPVPYRIEISHITDAQSGTIITIPIIKDSGSEQSRGFDFMIGFDTTLLTYNRLIPGEMYDIPGDYEWEFITGHLEQVPGCDDYCPSGLLGILSMADTDDGTHHPVEYYIDDGTVLFEIEFIITEHPAANCRFAPIRFFWTECPDNAIAYGPLEFIRMAVSDSVIDVGSLNIANPEASFPTYYGLPENCFDPEAPNNPERLIQFVNGGVDIQGTEPFTGRGDLNLNGTGYEQIDCLLFGDYFLYGLSVFTIDPDSQIAATDVIGDNIPLAVNDYAYLLRVTEDVLPAWPHCPPMTNESSSGLMWIIDTDTSLIIRSDFNLPAAVLHLSFYAPDMQSPGDYEIHTSPAIEHMDIVHTLRDDTLAILVSKLRQTPDGIPSATIDTGTVDLLEIQYGGESPLFASAEAAGYFAPQIILSVSAVPNYPPLFGDYPAQLENDSAGGFVHIFTAADPDNPPDQVYFTLLSGPGEIDSITGNWSYAPVCLDIGTTLTLEVCTYDIAHPCPQIDPAMHATVELIVTEPPPIPGDINADSIINLHDILGLLAYVYLDGPPPVPSSNVGDANRDGEINLSDILFLIEYVYFQGPEPGCQKSGP